MKYHADLSPPLLNKHCAIVMEILNYAAHGCSKGTFSKTQLAFFPFDNILLLIQEVCSVQIELQNYCVIVLAT